MYKYQNSQLLSFLEVISVLVSVCHYPANKLPREPKVQLLRYTFCT